jgi:hypothetical protein
MNKTILALAAAAAISALALPGSANAASPQHRDGIANPTQATDISARRRHHRHHRRWVRRHHWGSRHYRPYYGNYYAYAPYPYYRRYWGPGVYFGASGFGFGFGF